MFRPFTNEQRGRIYVGSRNVCGVECPEALGLDDRAQVNIDANDTFTEAVGSLLIRKSFGSVGGRTGSIARTEESIGSQDGLEMSSEVI